MLALGKRRLGIAVHIRTQASSSSSRVVHTLHRRACQLGECGHGSVSELSFPVGRSPSSIVVACSPLLLEPEVA